MLRLTVLLDGMQVDAELLDTAGPSLQVVSTMSVGYGVSFLCLSINRNTQEFDEMQSTYKSPN